MMNGAEILNDVILGSHTRVKAALEPLRLQVEAITGMTAEYDGCGGIRVMIDDSKFGSSKSANWAQIWKLAKAVRAALSDADYRVSKPHRGFGNLGMGQFIARDSFSVKVR